MNTVSLPLVALALLLTADPAATLQPLAQP
jgi:hypothetical protein